MNLNKPQPPLPSTSAKRLNTLAGKCLAVAATTSMAAACSGVPAKPEGKELCPHEVVRTMVENGLQLNSLASIQLYAADSEAIEREKKGEYVNLGKFVRVYENGPIISRVSDPEDSGLPQGTMLFGYIWVDADPRVAIVRYTEAMFPGGRKIPVCMAGGDLAGPGGIDRGIGKRPGSRPKAAMLGAVYLVGIVDVYP